MTLFASYAGSRVVSARVTIPAWGAWVADVALADEAEVSSRGTLVIGDVSLVGAVLRGGVYAGQRTLRLVGGAGGWRNTIPRQFYADPLGVRLGTVLKDVASKVGETVALTGTYAVQLLGFFWSRAQAPASEVLALTVPHAWYVDSAGVTQIGNRPASTITTGFDVTDYKPHLGLVTVATETMSVWQPGAMFTNPLLPAPLTAGSVTIAMDPKGRLRLEVLTA